MKNPGRLVQGNEAIALGALYAGARFYAGYPITPSSEIAEICSKEMARNGGVFIQMEDEIASICAIVGASATGVKAFTATSGPGFSLMQENIATAVIMEMPVVVVNVQRAGPCVGLATKPAQADFMQLRWGRHGDQDIVALIPSTVQECYELAVEAFNIAEELRIPVILAPEEIVGHLRENMTLPQPGDLPVVDRAKPEGPPESYNPFDFTEGVVAPLAPFGGTRLVRMTSAMPGEDGFTNSDPANARRRVHQLYSKLAAARSKVMRYKTYHVEDCDTLVVAFGACARAARTFAAEAREQGKKVGVFQVITVWPFPGQEIADLCGAVTRVVVPEMNYDGQMAGEIRKYVHHCEIRQVNTYNGEVLTPGDIARALI